MTTLHDAIEEFRQGSGQAWAWADLEAHLLAREDAIADALRLAGAQLGAMPELVAEALCVAELGTQPDTETRAFIHSQFHARLAWLREQFGQGGEGSAGV